MSVDGIMIVDAADLSAALRPQDSEQAACRWQRNSRSSRFSMPLANGLAVIGTAEVHSRAPKFRPDAYIQADSAADVNLQPDYIFG